MLVVALSLCGCTVNDHIVYFSGGAGFGNVFRIGDLKCPVKEAKVYLANYKNLFGTIGSVSLCISSETFSLLVERSRRK